MRSKLVLVGLVAVAACSGGDPQTAGSVAAAPAGSGVTTGTQGTFVAPTETKTYQAQGAVQSYSYIYTERAQYRKDIVRDAAGNPVLDSLGFPKREINRDSRTLVGNYHDDQLYSGNAATVRDPKINVTYDPRNAVFTLVINQNGVAANTTFQDPAHRTDFPGNITPQAGVPDLPTLKYLQADNGSGGGTSDVVTFFYEQPGTSTRYVTYAGYVRNRTEAPTEAVVADGTTTQTTDIGRRTLRERATFVFGEQTANSAVPKTGSASYTGGMIASIINNPTFENGDSSYFQWLSGTATTSVDFGAGTVSTKLAGTTLAPLLDASPIVAPSAGVPYTGTSIPAGAAFAANATAQLDLVGKGGFAGSFADASFTSGSTVQKVTIAGSSLDGAFYGPKAEEVGASFRIVGGVPDQRVDIVGSFTGKQ